MDIPTMGSVELPHCTLDVEVRGVGEPVVVIQTALLAEEFRSLAEQPALADFQVIRYHRRGYGDSTPVHGPRTVPGDALDCQQLLAVLDIERAHVVGGSYAGAVALQLAAAVPGRVHTLTLVEPPPTHVPAAEEFRAASRELLDLHRQQGASTALEAFMQRLGGTGWREDLEHRMPGGVEQAERDADTFFATDVPALLEWGFTAEHAARVTAPALHVGGSDSGPWFDQVREQLRSWFPALEEVVVDGAGHMLPITHPGELATAVADFLRRHPR